MDSEVPVDAFDGSPLDESGGRTVHFSFDLVDYEITLSAAHADEFASEVAPYIKVARRLEA